MKSRHIDTLFSQNEVQQVSVTRACTYRGWALFFTLTLIKLFYHPTPKTNQPKPKPISRKNPTYTAVIAPDQKNIALSIPILFYITCVALSSERMKRL